MSNNVSGYPCNLIRFLHEELIHLQLKPTLYDPSASTLHSTDVWAYLWKLEEETASYNQQDQICLQIIHNRCSKPSFSPFSGIYFCAHIKTLSSTMKRRGVQPLTTDHTDHIPPTTLTTVHLPHLPPTKKTTYHLPPTKKTTYHRPTNHLPPTITTTDQQTTYHRPRKPLTTDQDSHRPRN